LALFFNFTTVGFDFDLAFELLETLGMGAYLPWFVGLGNTEVGAGQWHDPVGSSEFL
jgi:hypothetical protein